MTLIEPMNRHSLLLALNKGDKNVILGKNGLNSKTLQCKKKCYCKKSVSAIAIEYNCILVTLHEKCPNTELFLVRIFLYSD